MKFSYALDVRLFFPDFGAIRSKPHIELAELVAQLKPGNKIEFSTPIEINETPFQVVVGRRLDNDTNPHIAIFEIQGSHDQVILIPKRLGATLNPLTGSFITTRDSLTPFGLNRFEDLGLKISEFSLREGEYALVRFDTKGGKFKHLISMASKNLSAQLVERVLPKSAWPIDSCVRNFSPLAN